MGYGQCKCDVQSKSRKYSKWIKLYAVHGCDLLGGWHSDEL